MLITVDAGRLWRAEQLGLFQPVKSAVLESRIPANLREPSGQWFGFSTRARVIAYNKAKVKPGEIRNYEDLADPKWKGRICMRSSTNIYNLSLMGALIDHLGEAEGRGLGEGACAPTSRASPRAATPTSSRRWPPGECDVAVSNQYYYARLLRSDKPDERAGRREASASCSRTRRPGARTSTSPAPAC